VTSHDAPEPCDRLDRIEVLLERVVERQDATDAQLQTLVRSVAATSFDVGQLAGTVDLQRQEMALFRDAMRESRDDIRRLYEQWTDHLREPRPNGHGPEEPPATD
jgi:hypothetical protein